VRYVVIAVFVLSVALVGAAALVAGGSEQLDGAGGGPGRVVGAAETTAEAEARATARLIIRDIAQRITPEMGDAHERLVAKGARKGKAFRMWSEFLRRLRERYGVTSLYTLVKLDRETVGVVVEAVEDPDEGDPWMAAYEMEPAMKRAFGGRVGVHHGEPWFDPRIRGGAPHVRALAPIFDSSGDVVAIIGVDVEVGDRRVAR
jgi:hypothetical protein